MFGDNVKPDKCDGDDYVRPASKTVRDLEVQLVLSLILGVGALIAFCVSCPPRKTCRMHGLEIHYFSMLIEACCALLDPAPAMADALCRAQEAPRSQHWPARADRLFLRMDPPAVQGV